MPQSVPDHYQDRAQSSSLTNFLDATYETGYIRSALSEEVDMIGQRDDRALFGPASPTVRIPLRLHGLDSGPGYSSLQSQPASIFDASVMPEDPTQFSQNNFLSPCYDAGEQYEATQTTSIWPSDVGVSQILLPADHAARAHPASEHGNSEQPYIFLDGLSRPNQLLPHFPSHHHVPPSTPLPTAPAFSEIPYPGHRERCRWDGCGMLLDDVTPGGIERHLKQHHIPGVWDRTLPGACRWHQGGDICNRPLVQGSYGRHVSPTHLRTTAVQCERCGTVVSRADVLRKHKASSCRGHP